MNYWKTVITEKITWSDHCIQGQLSRRQKNNKIGHFGVRCIYCHTMNSFAAINIITCIYFYNHESWRETSESWFLFLISGYVSWRSQVHGSWYISKLCEVFRKFCERYDVTSMMVKVNDEVSEAYTRAGYKQCPAPVVTLRRRIYFNNNWRTYSVGKSTVPLN